MADVAPLGPPVIGGRRPSAIDPGYLRRVVIAVAVVALCALGALAVYAGRGALLLLYVSALIATGLIPLVERLEQLASTERRRIPRWVVVSIVYALFVGGLAAVALLVLPTALEQADTLRRRVPSLLASWQSGLVKHGWIARPLTIADAVQQSTIDTGPGPTNQPIALAASAARGLAKGLFEVITVLILTFYILIDGPRVAGALSRAVPAGQREQVTAIAGDVTKRVSAWLRGNLLISAIVGSMTALAMGWLGEPYFWVVALVAAIAEAVPIAGPILAGIFAVLLAATVSPDLALSVALVFIVLHEIEANILIPKVMERQVGLSSLGVFAALLVGAEWFGVIGAILAIPTTAIGAAIVEELRRPSIERPVEAASA